VGADVSARETMELGITVVVPSLNETRTIEETVTSALEGIRLSGETGEVLIVDSSTDDTPELAQAAGARVLRVPKRGLGRAYIDALPHIRSRYVVMGDADCTYDFREIPLFIAQLQAGHELVIGTRMRGSIDKGAMPALHRYFGTPLTTWILNVLMGTRFSDIHCGLRAMTTEALHRLDLQSGSWEYASEMVVKSGLLNLRCSEVPIHFYKDRAGRQSHHKRVGWLSPWQAGWINLRVMLLYAPSKTIVLPAAVFLFIGLGLVFMQCGGPVTMGPITFSTTFMLLGLALAVLGVSGVQMGLLVETFSDVRRFRKRSHIDTMRRWFSYSRGMFVGAGSVTTGVALSSVLAIEWLRQDYRLVVVPWYVVFGLFLVIGGIQTILFNLVYQSFRLNAAE
jgi:hypothetical protein